MYDIFFSESAAWFTIPAIIGTGVFFLRLVLMSLGGAGIDMHHDLGMDVHTDFDAGHGDATHAFQILSIQSIAAFLMGFGWGGIGALRGSGWAPLTSVAVGILCGAAMVWLLGIMLKAAYDLQSSGNIVANDTIGSEGLVYASIPAIGDGGGQVQVIVNQRQRTYNAVSVGPPLATHARVKVVGIVDQNTLSVEPVET
ncbi:MAG: NfeD family protein [Pyrinomonadaceae bacterium]|nr:NfeD family protein [Phycisphaerales bacterium]